VELVLAALIALVIAAIVIDVKARRRGRRIRLSQSNVRNARWDNQGKLDQHKPGGQPPDATGIGGFGGFGG
jgi:hypothetical protein